MAESKLKEIIQTSLASIREVIDANTIIGEPIEIGNGSGTVIIPVSKVSMGYASGGVDYFGKNVSPAENMSNFGGGGGTGVSVSPVGFLVVKEDGRDVYKRQRWSYQAQARLKAVCLPMSMTVKSLSWVTMNPFTIWI